MDFKPLLILCFLSLTLPSDAKINAVSKHDDMPDMKMPPSQSPPSPAGSMNHMDSPEMTMHMTFFWGKHAQILFSNWPGTRAGMYALALVVVFTLAVLAEWLSHSRWITAAGGREAGVGLAQTAAYIVRVGVGYLVMLAVMSFNGGVFIVAVLGHGFGFLVFGSRVFRDTAASAPKPVC